METLPFTAVGWKSRLKLNVGTTRSAESLPQMAGNAPVSRYFQTTWRASISTPSSQLRVLRCAFWREWSQISAFAPSSMQTAGFYRSGLEKTPFDLLKDLKPPLTAAVRWKEGRSSLGKLPQSAGK